MALHPEVQKKAQAEIDAVVGLNRLPDFHDRPSLPYINAVVKESSRWNLVVPLGRPFVTIIIITITLTSSEGIPHMSTTDDEYNGFYIPKGTIMIANAWLVEQPLNPIFYPEFHICRSILHDRKVFNNPQEFQPERYLKDGKLNPDVRDPDCAAFGFGRRSVNTFSNIYTLINSSPLNPYSICPGRNLSDNSLYSIVSCLLAVYDIKPPVDDQGNTLKLKPEFTTGLLT